MAKKELKIKENPKLCQRELSNGEIALYLEFYHGRSETPKLDSHGAPMVYPEGSKMSGKPMMSVKHIRTKENLGLYLKTKPRTPQDRQHNADTLAMAEAIRFQKAQEFMQDRYGYSVSKRTENVVAYFDKYVSEYNKRDLRNIQLAVNRFKSFLRESYPHSYTKKSNPDIEKLKSEWREAHKGIYGRHDINENAFYNFRLTPNQFTTDMVNKFVEYLRSNSKGSGAATAFERFKKIVRQAVADKVLKIDVCQGIICKREDNFEKDILSVEEIQQLVSWKSPVRVTPEAQCR